MWYNAGLILEGGGMRGIFTCGVIDALIENEIEISTIYGVSAGACHAVSLITKQLGRAWRITTDYIGQKDYMGLRSLVTTGNYFGENMLFNRLHTELDPLDYDEYEKFISRGKFYSVVSNLRTGKPEYLTQSMYDMTHGMRAICASSSMPILSKRCKIGDDKYLDGAMTDAIPIHRSIEDGNKKNILVLTRNDEYVKHLDKALPLDCLWYWRYPKFLKQIANRHKVYNATREFIKEEEKAGRAFVIKPQKPVTVGVAEKNKTKLRDLYNQGYELASKSAPAMIKFLSE
ncbi:MAG: patatin family protein [Methanocorpusculum sp.]|nr:patatin family protein [Methanocorpusculum sp.]